MAVFNVGKRAPVFMGADASLKDQAGDALKAVAATTLEAFTKKLTPSATQTQNAPPPPPPQITSGGKGIFDSIKDTASKFPGGLVGAAAAGVGLIVVLGMLGKKKRSPAVVVAK